MNLHVESGEIERIMHYGTCHEEVTRKGESQPCNKVAVAVRVDPEDYGPYPVCAHHTRAAMVPLSAILANLTLNGLRG